MNRVEILTDNCQRATDEISVLVRQAREIEGTLREKQNENQEIKKDLERAILAYWADNGKLNGTCFKTVEFNIENNDFFFRILDGGRQDGNNQLIYLVEGFFPSDRGYFNPGHYFVEWRAIQTVDLNPKNVISLEEFEAERSAFKALWESCDLT